MRSGAGNVDHLRVGHTVNDRFRHRAYEAADNAIAATGADIGMVATGPTMIGRGDYIQVPTREQFAAREYYQTICHELCIGQHPNGSIGIRQSAYAMGELIAEMGACFLRSELGIPNATRYRTTSVTWNIGSGK